jgi:hypothetical protein
VERDASIVGTNPADDVASANLITNGYVSFGEV